MALAAQVEPAAQVVQAVPVALAALAEQVAARESVVIDARPCRTIFGLALHSE